MTTGITKEICAQLSGDVYNFTTPPADWELLADHTNLLSLVSPSFAAGAYYNKKTNEIIIAYRGSEFDVDDWINNNFGGWGCDDLPEQFDNAYDFLNNLKNKINNGDYSSIIGENRNFDSLAGVGITGHSLGGGLAELMGALDICKDYQIYSFNGIGAGTLVDDLQKKHAVSGDYSNIHNYMVRGDIVSSLFPHLGDDKNYVQATHPTLEKVPIKIKGVATLFYTLTNEVNIKGTHGWDNFIGSNAFQETISLSTYKTVFEILNTTKVEPILTNAILPSIKIFVKALYGMFDEETSTKKWMSKRADIHGNPTGGAASIEGGVSCIVHEQLDNACNAFMTLDLPFIAKVVNLNATDVNEKISIVVEDFENAQNKLNALINSNPYVEAYLNGTEFVYDKEKSQNHIWSYTDKSVYTEIKEFLNMSSQLEVSYINENEDGDSIIISDSGNNYLAGEDGNDIYIVGDTFGNDTIRDIDGKGSITYMVQKEVPSESDTVMALNANEVTPATETLLEEMQLYGSSEKPVSKGLWKDCKGNKYAWSGADGDTLTINDKITVNNFKSGDLGIVLNEFPEPDEIKIDPLVLDLDGDGVELVDLENSTAYFDLNADGIKEKTQWVSADDGLLALDRNQNGQIDGIDEVFGNPATIGFDVLNQYDTNGDSVIDSNDTKFSQFKVWQDLNQNGSVDDGELSSLEENNIASINLNYNQPANADDSTYREYSTVTKTDGSTMTIMDVNLEVSPENTKYDPVAVSDEIAALPQLIGSGVVKDLHSSMAQNSDLKAVVDDLLTQNATAVYQNFDSLLKIWTGVITDELTMRGSFSATKAAIVEKFYNRQYTLTQNDGTTEEIPSNKAEHFETLYQSLKNSMFAKFIIETGNFSCLNGITYNNETNTFLAPEDKSILNTAIASFVSTASVEDTAILGIVLDQLRRNYVFDFDSTALSETVEQIKKDALEADSISFGVGQQGNTFILGTSEDDSITDTAGCDIYYTGDGDDTITSTGYGSDVVYSGNGNDTINMKNGNMEIYAGDGDDNITIYDGNVVIEGGLGNDTIKTNYTNNVFVFNLGDGQDTITTEISANSGKTDTIRFGEGISWEDLEFEKAAGTANYPYSPYAGADLVISIKNTDDKITVKNWFPNANDPMSSNYDYKIENIEFADGSIYTQNDIYSGLPVIGTDSDDVLTGTWQNNTINAGLGNDTITDSEGNETYIFNLGDGQDTILDTTGTDKILFGEGITVENLEFTRVQGSGSNETKDGLFIKIKNTNDSVLIQQYYYKDSYNHFNPVFPNQIESIEFSDGTTLTVEEIENLRINKITDNDDYIYGKTTNDTYLDLNGNNTFIDKGGDDNYTTGDGDDYIRDDYHEITDDYMTCSRVNGNDSCNTGAGNDIIEDYSGGNDLINSGDGNDTIKVGYSGDKEIHAGSGDDYIEVSADNATIEGGLGNDTIKTNYTNNVFVFNLGDGQDTITTEGDSRFTDTIRFGEGISWEDLEFEKAAGTPDYSHSMYTNDDLVISIKNTDDKITIRNWFPNANNIMSSNYDYKIENIELADGSVYTQEDIYKGTVIQGTGSADSITGTWQNNTINAGLGNDTITDSEGNETYIFNLGDGQDTILDLKGTDKIVFGEGITLIDLDFTRIPGDYDKGERDGLLIKINNTNDSILIQKFYVEETDYTSVEEVKTYPYRIETIEFANGTTIAADEIEALRTIKITDGDDYIYGKPTDDIYSDLKGNNTIIDNGGNDTYTTGDGNDTIIDKGGNNTYNTGAGNDTIYDDTNGTSIINSGDGNDTIKAYSGDKEINAGSGDDYIEVSADNARIEGGLGNDTIKTNYANNVFVFNLGDGQDTITTENSANSGKTDTIRFGEGISWEDLEFEKAAGTANYPYSPYAGADLVISIKNTDDKITVKNWFPNANDPMSSNYDYKIENFIFADNTTFLKDKILVELINKSEAVIGTSEDDSLTGTAANNIFYGKEGNDIISDIYGGNDTYIFNLGDGQDTITDLNGTDKILFGEGISSEDIYIAKNDADLVISIANTNDSITVLNWGSGYDNQIENLEFFDGTVLSNINGLIKEYNGSDDSDEIIGNIQDNIINGLSGADTMIGDLGDDTYITDNINDTIIENEDEGYDRVESSVSYTLPANFEELILTGTDNINAAGNSADNYLEGNSGNNTFEGKAGNDSFYDNQGGNDTYIYNIGDGNDNITDNSGNDKIVFGEGINADMLRFAKEADNLHIWFDGLDDSSICINSYFGDDNNKIETIEFADGSTLSDLGELVSIYASETGDIILPDGILEAHLWGEGNTSATGNDLDNNFCGNAGNNTFEGKQGDDNYWDDQGGNETYLYNLGDGNDYITDFNGYDTIRFGEGISSDDITLKQCSEHLFINIKETENDIIVNNYFTNEENKIEKIEFADGTSITDIDTAIQEFIGNEEDNYLIGNSSDNYFDACEGADTMVGLAGDDTYLADNENDIVIEAQNEGTDKVIAAGVSYTLPENVEDLILQYGNINGTGNFLDNVIVSSDENNIMSGMGGNDTYIFNNDWGEDTVIDSEGQNTISIYSDISSNDLTFAMNGNDLEILQLDSLNKITISNWTQNEVNRNFTVELNGETAFTSSQIESIISQNSNNIFDDSYINMLIQEVNSYGVESEMISMDSGINQNEEQILLTMNTGM